MAPFVGLDLIGENDIATFDLYLAHPYIALQVHCECYTVTAPLLSIERERRNPGSSLCEKVELTLLL